MKQIEAVIPRCLQPWSVPAPCPSHCYAGLSSSNLRSAFHTPTVPWHTTAGHEEGYQCAFAKSDSKRTTSRHWQRSKKSRVSSLIFSSNRVCSSANFFSFCAISSLNLSRAFRISSSGSKPFFLESSAMAYCQSITTGAPFSSKPPVEANGFAARFFFCAFGSTNLRNFLEILDINQSADS